MKLCFTIIGILLFVNSYSQWGKQLHYRFQHLGQSDGLWQSRVQGITQFKHGYIWIATFPDGLQRYDGVRFQNFNDKFENLRREELRLNPLFNTGSDLFTYTDGQLYKLNKAQNRFILFPLKGKPLTGKILIDDDSNKWEITLNWIFLRTKMENRDTTIGFPIATPVRGGTNPVVYDSTNNQYWIGYNGAIYLLDLKSQKVYSSKKNIEIPFLNVLNKKEALHYMFLDNENNLWVIPWVGGIIRYNLLTKKITDFPPFHQKMTTQNNLSTNSLIEATCIFQDRHNQLWVGTYGGGLLKFNKRTDCFDYILADKNDPFSIRYNYEIFSIFQDRDDNIWVGTDNGISIFNPYKEPYKTISYNPHTKQTIPYNEIQPLLQLSNKDIWIGSWGGGITVFDPEWNFKNRIVSDVSLRNLPWYLIEDSQKRVWISGQRGLIQRYDIKKGKIDSLFYINDSRSTIRCMLKDRGNNIYFGLQNGKVAKWISSQNRFVEYNHGAPIVSRTSNITNLFQDEQERIWASTVYGIYLFDTSRMVFIDSFFTSPKRIFNSNGLVAAPFDEKSILLSKSDGGGGYFNGQSKTFRQWNLRKDSRSVRIAAVKKDHQGNIWFTGGRTIYHFYPGREYDIKVHSLPEGLINSSFRPSPIVEINDNQWATFTDTEVIIFSPDKLIKNNGRPKMATITGLRVFGQPISVDSFLINNTPVFLKPKQNFITIEFSPLQYFETDKIKYTYKLSGVDENWVFADDSFSASYTNLEPGEYTFSVKPVGVDGGSLISIFKFTITPPFWHTWWFFSICILSVSSLTVWLIRRRIKTIRREANLKQQILETEMAALRAQMNPHFIFNCLSAIDNLIQNNEKDKATTYLARFARLIRNILDSSNTSIVPFYKDFETVKLFIELEKLRNGNNFTYELNADNELLNGSYSVPPLIIQPFIENAIRHGLRNKESGDRLLQVKANLKEDHIIYTITDNGVGRKRAEELNRINRTDHVSYGTQISKNRIRDFNDRYSKDKSGAVPEDLMITDLFEGKVSTGTRITVRLRINPES